MDTTSSLKEQLGLSISLYSSTRGRKLTDVKKLKQAFFPDGKTMSLCPAPSGDLVAFSKYPRVIPSLHLSSFSATVFGRPGRGWGWVPVEEEQKCKLEVTDILRGVFIGRNSSTHPAQRYKIGVNMISNRNPQMNNHLSRLPRIDFFAQPLSQRGEKWRIEKEATTGSSLSDFPLHQTQGDRERKRWRSMVPTDQVHRPHSRSNS
ncbi:hypothetical protein V6N12_013010 [Hibiscus sabdariffa]|uniref:Uncharacterized protein n=1 Tax=Hibiscus sabdariffa TaxID=183260 RepID=A0ABR2EG39_9ROSI